MPGLAPQYWLRRQRWLTQGSGALSITFPALPSAEAFGTIAVQPQAVNVAFPSTASGEAFGALTVQPGGAEIALAAIVSGEALGAPTIVSGAVSVSLSGVPTEEEFGFLVLDLEDEEEVFWPSIPSAETFGNISVIPWRQIGLLSILSSEAFGSLLVYPAVVGATDLPIDLHIAQATELLIPAHRTPITLVSVVQQSLPVLNIVKW